MGSAFATNRQDGVVFEGPVYSDILRTDRTVRICLPARYGEEPSRRYPVIYVHDGQNAFTTAGPHAAFGWGNWQLDATARDLAAAGKMAEIILVAIDCSSRRYREYRGPAAATFAAAEPNPRWDSSEENAPYLRYARFLARELKPQIDREFRTLPGPAHTGLIGSSMGGVASLALGWQYPRVFGRVASLSGAFQVENRAFLRKVLRPHEGAPKPIRVYLDSGMIDNSGEDDGMQDTADIKRELVRIGWKEGKNLLHFIDPPLAKAELEQLGLPHDKLAEAQTSQHNELYWRLRAGRALAFLFPPKK